MGSSPPPAADECRARGNREALFEKIELWLDEGMGSCLFRTADSAHRVVRELHATDGIHCELGCYVVMPNHVHAIVRPLSPRVRPLEEVLRLWKGASAREINLSRQSSGKIWQKESHDRIIRDAEHLYRVIQYIGRNPRRAGQSPRVTPLWIRPSWRDLGWDFDDP